MLPAPPPRPAGRTSWLVALLVTACADPTAGSCAALEGTECRGASCCEHPSLPGGEFLFGRGTERCASCTDGCPAEVASYCEAREQPERPSALGPFALDRFEVTVGRFRAFVEAGGGTGSRPPPPGSGAHPAIAGSGWDPAWDAELPADQEALRAQLRCVDGLHTWTDAPGARESMPINCVSWYVAMAFCIWDGGRLPTEAEWEHAAAGGDENRVFPWGDEGVEDPPANLFATDNSPFVEVGSYPAGDGRWGHADLAGSLWEWALDGYAVDAYEGAPRCDDCAHLAPTEERVIRGGNWYSSVGTLRATYRLGRPPDFHRIGIGIRCAR